MPKTTTKGAAPKDIGRALKRIFSTMTVVPMDAAPLLNQLVARPGDNKEPRTPKTSTRAKVKRRL